MKLTKQSNKIKSRIVSVLAIIALILCTVLSFVLILPSGDALAESEDDIAKKREANGIKFVQVAAGEDFAIGLTYDGKLYGWSLKSDQNRRSDLKDNYATLGDYYTTKPTEINVVFRTGPQSNYTFGSTGGTTNYHTPTDDSIKAIAATRNTAAFVTQRGYLYTWGKDTSYFYDVDHNESGREHHLLLRQTGDNGAAYSWTIPYIIDYYYFGSTTDTTQSSSRMPLEQCIPSGNGVGSGYMSLVAGEYNYAFMFVKSYQGGTGFGNSGTYYHTYIWGSMLYNAVNTEPKTRYDYGSRLSGSTSREDVRKIFNTFIPSTATGVSIAAGGYTVAINNRNSTVIPGTNERTVYGTSLLLRGRNFITTQGVTADGNNYTVQQTTKVISGNADGIKTLADSGSTNLNDSGRAVANILSGSTTALDAIAGGNGRAIQDGQIWGIDVEQYYARQKSDSELKEIAYNITGETQSLRNSRNEEIEGLAATRYAVSLGNDMGYGISGGNVYGWGDNFSGQLQLDTIPSNITYVESDDKYSDAPVQILSDKGATFISVAAGKQLSKKDKAFSANVSTISDNEFVAGVKNEDKYISAALTANGSIYAWSKDIQATELFFEGISDNNKKESFIAIYSAYGENLFAVTTTGKLVRITVIKNDDGSYSFAQHTYDEFNDVSGKGIDNWTVNNTNNVVFKVSVPEGDDVTAEQKINPDLGNATFYVWSVAPSDSEAENKTILINNTTTTPYRSLVGVNNIGDAYRIIGFKEADKNINYLKADNLSDNLAEDEDTYYAPRYYFDGKLMSDAQRDNMFESDVVYANGAGVGIYIKPKQSSKGKDITIKFYIARYNNYEKYTVSGENATDNAIYYDYKECTITFSIADTPSVLTYSAYNSEQNSNIPLLDPNNPNNTYYSLAVQNVSLGVDKLIQFLTGEESVNDEFKAAVIEQMNAKDNGFPAKAKIEAGDLKYYLSEADQGKYNDVYQFMFTDRDSDRVTLAHTGVGGSDPIVSHDNVKGEIKTIEVKVKFADTEKDYGLGSKLTGKTAAQILKAVNTEFDNTYGLYGFAVDEENITFKYDVVMFTAIDAVGTVSYTGKTDAETSVNKYTTASGGARASFYASTLIGYSYDDVKGYVEGNKYSDRERMNSVAYVYSKPTLRLKSNLEAGKVTDVNGNVGGTKNTYTRTFTNELYVGDSAIIKLEDYVNHIDTGNISFSFNNSSDTDALKKFSDQFIDFTGQNMPVLSLSANTITITPTTAAPINFTVEVQRFADDAKRYFTADSKADEKIYLTFKFNNIIGFKLNKNGNAKTTFLVTDTTTIELFGDASTGTIANKDIPFINILGQNDSPLANNTAAAKAYTALKANARIYGISSSEENKSETEKLFDFTKPTDSAKTKFTITPKRSGSGVIQFSANIYDKSVSFIITVNVSKETRLTDSDTITVIDDQYITVSELNEALRNSNSFNPDVTAGNYKILYSDIKNPEATRNNDRIYNAIYFTNKSGDVGTPSFVQNAVFEAISSDPTIRIISSNSTTQQSETYYMHVRYTNADSSVTSYETAPESSIIEIVVPVVSGKIKLKTGVGGSDLVASVNCRRSEEEKANPNDWLHTEGDGLDTKVTIELKYLLDLDGTEAPDTYRIFLLSADSAAAQYFQYDKSGDSKSIEITPKDNTPDNFELNVSVFAEGKPTKVLSFEISVKGIITTLPVMTEDGIIGYGNIWLYSFAIVFGVLLIIFVVRFIVYMRKRAKQRAIIKRNQDLIRLRDRMHGKANAASREQLVKAKLKMENPKYAKAFNDMRRDKEEDSGVTLENSDLAATAEKKAKKKKKKGGKKTVAELKAELAAKKAAFAAAQAGNAQPVNPFATDIPMDGGGFVPPDAGFGVPPDAGFVTPDDGGFVTPDAGFVSPDIDGNEIVFDASDLGDGNM